MNEILAIYLQVVHGLKGMHQHVSSFLGSKFTLCFLTKTNKIQSITIDSDKIKVLGQIEASNFGFPELEGVMFVDGVLFFRNQIIDLDTVSVHVNSLVTDHEFFALIQFVSYYHDLSIINVKSTFCLQDELVLLRG